MAYQKIISSGGSIEFRQEEIAELRKVKFSIMHAYADVVRIVYRVYRLNDFKRLNDSVLLSSLSSGMLKLSSSDSLVLPLIETTG
jgi:hypothetical protein